MTSSFLSEQQEPSQIGVTAVPQGLTVITLITLTSDWPTVPCKLPLTSDWPTVPSKPSLTCGGLSGCHSVSWRDGTLCSQPGHEWTPGGQHMLTCARAAHTDQQIHRECRIHCPPLSLHTAGEEERLHQDAVCWLQVSIQQSHHEADWKLNTHLDTGLPINPDSSDWPSQLFFLSAQHQSPSELWAPPLLFTLYTMTALADSVGHVILKK